MNYETIQVVKFTADNNMRHLTLQFNNNAESFMPFIVLIEQKKN